MLKAKSKKHASRSAAHSPGPQIKPTSRMKFIRVSRLARLLDVDQSTLWRWRRDGVLPPPVRIGGIVGWPEHQLLDVLAKHQTSEREG
jgi:predicted DNA-binding transcriptional regulator AlpA